MLILPARRASPSGESRLFPVHFRRDFLNTTHSAARLCAPRRFLSFDVAYPTAVAMHAQN